MTTRAVFICALLLAAASAAEVPKDQDAFQQLLQKVQTEPGKVSEDQVKELIAAGQRLGHGYAVSLALKGYLAQAPQVSPALLLAAAENALWAGDFRTAAARCKAVLDIPQGDGVAPEAAGLLCRVLVDFLGADDEAYRFLAANAERFRQAPGGTGILPVGPQAGRLCHLRFDAWFLDALEDFLEDGLRLLGLVGGQLLHEGGHALGRLGGLGRRATEGHCQHPPHALAHANEHACSPVLCQIRRIRPIRPIRSIRRVAPPTPNTQHPTPFFTRANAMAPASAR